MSLFALAAAAGVLMIPGVERLGPRAAVAVDTACQVLHPKNVPVTGRKSPLDSLTFAVARRQVKLCYGRPSSRGRVMLGGAAVPYGKLWRTGANEPTILFTPIAITVGGIAVPAGAYSLYTVPTAGEWEVIVNRSISQWGEESNYTPAIQAQEVGRAKVKTEPLAQAVDTLTIWSEPAPRGADVLLEWERTRVRIPVRPS